MYQVVIRNDWPILFSTEVNDKISQSGLLKWVSAETRPSESLPEREAVVMTYTAIAAG